MALPTVICEWFEADGRSFCIENRKPILTANSYFAFKFLKDAKNAHTKVAANFRIYSLQFTYLASDELVLGKHRVPLEGKTESVFRK